MAAAVCAAGLGLLAAGCVATSGGDPREQVIAPAELGLSGAPYPFATDGWWHALQDPQLDQLIAAALARNPGLAGALARVRSAREQVEVAGAARSPQLALQGAAERTRFSENYIIPPPYG
ncbi:MAG: TolC family protein, partial [Steroidobacteraceae bacterium]